MLLLGVAAALAMGLPTLRGTFVGGDDQRLVLNHVLVNHPSILHAVQLFTIVHRDLYQPLPLLTFSAEFLITDWLGLFRSGVEGGAWLFHLDNVLLHAINAALVWLLIARLHSRWSPQGTIVATIVALLFAVHPLQVETVAWVNGRMMLLSTLFALAAMLSFDRWLERGTPLHAVLTPLFVLLSSISKVRAGLPLLLLLLVLTRRERSHRRFWPVWILAGVISGFFVWLNVGATAGADLFAEGAEHLRGPRPVRVLMALAFYLQHLVWPTCLTSYYPTPPVVSWLDPATIRALIVLAMSALAVGWMCVRSPACRFGALWFLIAIADTLPVFPARNILAADRYVYLPIIGLLWCVGALAVDVLGVNQRSPTRRWALSAVSALIVAALVGTSWYTAKWYNSALLKTQRVAECFPDEPRVWEKLGWTHHQLGQYDKAIEFAEKEMRQDSPAAVSGACQLIGLSHLRMGNGEEALRWLQRAVGLDPATDIGKYRLGLAYEELGRIEEAVSSYEAAAEVAPGHNPTLLRLAGVYRRLGRPQDARAAYAKALENNAYEIPAIIGLVELDTETDSPQACREATARLVKLLEDVPDDLAARLNLAALLLLRTELTDVPAAAKSLTRAKTSAARIDAALAFAALVEGRHDEALAKTLRAISAPSDAAEGRRLLLSAMQRFDEQRPGVAWTYGLTAEVLIADGQGDAARAFLSLFESNCREPSCQSYTPKLRQKLRELADN